MRNAFIALTLFVVLGAGAYFLLLRPHLLASSSGGSEATSTASSTPAIVTPDYKTPIAFSSDITADEKTEINQQLATIQAQIDQNKLDLNAWINLGAIHKIGGDYDFAIQAWNFVAQTYPSNEVAFYNLGDLYENSLKDYPKAEANYLEAIKVLPKDVQAYASLFTLYHYQYKVGTGADAAIIEEGLKNNPNDPTLLGLKSELQ